MSWLASTTEGALAGARPGRRLLERIDLELHALLLYLAAAVSGAVAGRGVRGALASADTDVMCRANSSGTAAVGISASGSSLIGAPDGVTLISWNPVRAPRVRAVDQIGHAERVEPQGGAAAGALREPARDQRRGDTGGDVAQARGQGEQRGQMAEGHDEQEGRPLDHPERVRELQAAHHARRRQGARHHRDPAQRQQQCRGSRPPRPAATAPRGRAACGTSRDPRSPRWR